MSPSSKQKIIEVCDRKIVAKGSNVGLSFYAFFSNKNDQPEALVDYGTTFESLRESRKNKTIGNGWLISGYPKSEVNASHRCSLTVCRLSIWRVS